MLKSGQKRPTTPNKTRSAIGSPESADHWRQGVRETVLTARPDGSLNFSIHGGSDNGEFAYVSDIVQNKVNYVSGSLNEGDVVLEIQGQKVAGYTQRDVVAWLNHCCRNGNPVTLKTIDAACQQQVDPALTAMLEEDTHLFKQLLATELQSPQSSVEPQQQNKSHQQPLDPALSAMLEKDTNLFKQQPPTPPQTPQPPAEPQQQNKSDQETQLSECDILLFARTYNLTDCRSKRVNIGIEANKYCNVVVEIENVRNGVKLRLNQMAFEELYQALPYINAQMTSEYNPPRFPQVIKCFPVKLYIEDLYNDVALKLTSGDSTIYLRHSSVMNLWNICRATRVVVDRLISWHTAVKAQFNDVMNDLKEYSIHVNDLGGFLISSLNPVPKSGTVTPITLNSIDAKFTKGIPQYFIAPIDLQQICSEFYAYKKQIFAKYCMTGDYVNSDWDEEDDDDNVIRHPDYYP